MFTLVESSCDMLVLCGKTRIIMVDKADCFGTDENVNKLFMYSYV